MPACLLGPVESITPATEYPVTVAATLDRCRIDLQDDNSLVSDLIGTATNFCQRRMDRQLMSATFDVPLRGWWYGLQYLPLPPLQSVTSVKYYATDDTLTTLSSAYYTVRKPLYGAGSLELAPNYVWPPLQVLREFPVVVRIVAGYASAALVPDSIKTAIYLMVDYLYENRGDADVKIPDAIGRLLDMDGWGSCV